MSFLSLLNLLAPVISWGQGEEGRLGCRYYVHNVPLEKFSGLPDSLIQSLKVTPSESILYEKYNADLESKIALGLWGDLMITFQNHHAKALNYRLNLLDQQMESILKNSQHQDLVPLNSKSTSTEVYSLTMNNQIQLAFKPFSKYWELKTIHEGSIGFYANPLAERAAYLFDRMIRLYRVPLTVMLKVGEKEGSSQLWSSGVKGVSLDKIPRAERLKEMLFDYLINNWDRHSENHLFYQTKLVLIDHGMAFEPMGLEKGSHAPKPLSKLPMAEMLDTIPDMIEAIHALDDQEVRSTLNEYLSTRQINELIERKNLFLRLKESVLKSSQRAQ